jgi:cytochrome c-type biogenesis protein CcmH/NrfG
VFNAVDLNGRGGTAEAVKMLEFLLEENPGSLNGLWQLANIKRGLGDRKGAIDLYRKCLEIMPNMTPARQLLERLEAQEE